MIFYKYAKNYLNVFKINRNINGRDVVRGDV